MKKILLIIMIVFSAFVMAIPAGAAANPGFDDKEIRIAQFGPQTGPAAPWGAVARGGALLAEIVNAEGGIHGRKIKYFIRDDQYSPAVAQMVVKELVDKHGIFPTFPA